MPGLWHDSGNELFRDDPEFARRLFRLAGVDLPSDVQLIPAPTNETDRTLSNDLDPDTVLEWQDQITEKLVARARPHRELKRPVNDPLGKLRRVALRSPTGSVEVAALPSAYRQSSCNLPERGHGQIDNRADPAQRRGLRPAGGRSAGRVPATLCTGNVQIRDLDHVGGLVTGRPTGISAPLLAGIRLSRWAKQVDAQRG